MNSRLDTLDYALKLRRSAPIPIRPLTDVGWRDLQRRRRRRVGGRSISCRHRRHKQHFQSGRPAARVAVEPCQIFPSIIVIIIGKTAAATTATNSLLLPMPMQCSSLQYKVETGLADFEAANDPIRYRISFSSCCPDAKHVKSPYRARRAAAYQTPSSIHPYPDPSISSKRGSTSCGAWPFVCT